VQAPNGDILVSDGYGQNRIHRFTARGEYVLSFGGGDSVFIPRRFGGTVTGTIGTGPCQFNVPHDLVSLPNSISTVAILALYAVMRGIDRRLVRAASVFGAGPWQAFLRVFLPLSVPGVAGGCLLVFVLALGFFITPALMGGPHQTMIAMLIDTEVDQLLNWSVASALAMVLLAITLVGLFLYDRLVGLETLLQGRC